MTGGVGLRFQFYVTCEVNKPFLGLTMALKGDINQDDVAVGVNALQEINKNVQESKTLYLYDYK